MGPQMRLWQNFGVANVTTNGTPLATESATEYSSSERSGGSAVVSAARSPFVDASVGVSLFGAGLPTAGVASSGWTLSPVFALRCLPSTV